MTTETHEPLTTYHIPPDRIDLHPYQPRAKIDADELLALGASIAERGLQQPIVVRRKGEHRYELIAGQRRLAAWHSLAGTEPARYERIPAFVRSVTDAQMVLDALTENQARVDLDPVEEALTMRRALDEIPDLTQAQLADTLGISAAQLSNRLRILRLPQRALDKISDGSLAWTTARELLRLWSNHHSHEAEIERVLDCMDRSGQKTHTGPSVRSCIILVCRDWRHLESPPREASGGLHAEVPRFDIEDWTTKYQEYVHRLADSDGNTTFAATCNVEAWDAAQPPEEPVVPAAHKRWAEKIAKRLDLGGAVDVFSKEKFQEPDCPVHSFQQLVVAAESSDSEIVFPFPVDSTDEETQSVRTYIVDHILEDGCFLEPTKLCEILDRLKAKKNLILQGPPGTGKTWLAKRLAYALIGHKDTDKVRSVQFHPNLSYEDFVRGYRPNVDSKLNLVNGPFIEMIDAAKSDPASKHVMVIEEINRGNPAQIFGEMLTLLEADKRNEDEALELTYRKHDGERVHIPQNLYVIGTMNMADRSLAMVDFALRRRFAFVNMEPALNERWSGWVHEHYEIDPETLQRIKDKLDSLNQTIADDPNLGPQFRIGHSFVTPTDKITDAGDWFRQVVETEIGPLLDEYWYDDRQKAQEERNRLLGGI